MQSIHTPASCYSCYNNCYSSSSSSWSLSNWNYTGVPTLSNKLGFKLGKLFDDSFGTSSHSQAWS